MKDTKYIRRNNIITEISTGMIQQFKSINQAKKASFDVQMKNDGALGRGSVMLK